MPEFLKNLKDRLGQAGVLDRCEWNQQGSQVQLTSNGRSCQWEISPEGWRCSLSYLGVVWLRQVLELPLSELTELHHEWLVERVDDRELLARHSLVALVSEEKSLLETIADRDWRSYLEAGRAGDPILQFHLPLLELLSQHPGPRRLFPFTSHWTLCFSRCPEYPYATRDLPQIGPTDNPQGPPYGMNSTWGQDEFELLGFAPQIAQAILPLLEIQSRRVFMGNVDDQLRQRVNRELRACGSRLRCSNDYLEVEQDNRRCGLAEIDEELEVSFWEDERHIAMTKFAPIRAAHAVRAWLEEKVGHLDLPSS